MAKQTNRLHMEQILVAYCPGASDQNLAQGALVDATTTLGIDDGQIGLLSWDHQGATALGSFITTGQTSSDVSAIKILQGTPNSANILNADPFQAGHKGYVESGIIRSDKIRSVQTSTCRHATLGGMAVGSFDAAVPQDNTDYVMYLTLDSVRNDQFWGPNDEVITATFQSPDYTALSLTDDEDHLLSNVLYELNQYSRLVGRTKNSSGVGNRNFVALAVNTTGGSGTAIGTATCGDSIDFMTDGVQTYSITLDDSMVMALGELIGRQNNDANIAAGDKIDALSTIEVINLATAGAAANINAFVILGLPEQKAVAFDNVRQLMVQPSVELGGGFIVDTDEIKTTVYADEGEGYGWQWLIQNDNRWQLAIMNMQNHPHGDYYNEGEKYIDPDYLYTSYIIEYYDTESTLTTQEYTEKRLILLVQCGITCVTVATAATNIETNLDNLATPGSRVAPMTTVDVGCFGSGAAATATNLRAELISDLKVWIDSCSIPYKDGKHWNNATSALV